jgi:cobalt-zinc-cadmium resistance protein CzcA
MRFSTGGSLRTSKTPASGSWSPYPVALALILFLLYLAFQSGKEVLIIFMAVPLSAIGGILALQLRGMPFSISSGIGFIALFGISVLNGIVLISAIKQLPKEHFDSCAALVKEASLSRLRPVLMTALVAAFGFLPMALSTGNGAEVQQPLATVVIGGLISSTLLTLLILPVLYTLLYKKQWPRQAALILLIMTAGGLSAPAQNITSFESLVEYAANKHPALDNMELDIAQTALNEQMIGQWAPAELGYQGGQINYSGYDHFFTIDQNLNHFWGRKAKKEVVKSELDVLQHDKLILLRELEYKLKMAYDEWAFKRAQLLLADSILQLYQSLEPKVQLQLAEGEISQLEAIVFEQQIIYYQRALKQQQLEANTALYTLKQLAFLPDEAMIDPPVFEQIPVDAFVLDEQQSLYARSYYLKQSLVEKEMSSLEQQKENTGFYTRLFPPISGKRIFLSRGWP